MQKDDREKSGLGLWRRSKAAAPGRVVAEATCLALAGHSGPATLSQISAGRMDTRG